METISNEIFEMLAEDVISKKELKNLNKSFVIEKVTKHLVSHKRFRKRLLSENYSKLKRGKEFKAFIKVVRAELREIYGVFILQDYDKLSKYLELLKKDFSIDNHNKILSLHKSTKERLEYYSLVYKQIFDIIPVPKKIVDLACGLNPFSYPYLECKPEYYAYDLNEKDMSFINKYFNMANIIGKAKSIDLIKDNLKEICKDADVVFLFKTLDSLEAVKKNISRKIIKELSNNTANIVVSFPTMSIGGKKDIKMKKRMWFNKLVSRSGFKVKQFNIPGEMFYVLSKIM